MSRRAKKISLVIERKRRLPPFARCDPDRTVVQWRRALPFFVNDRGILVHRVRSVKTHLQSGKPKHISLHYLCMNGTTTELDGEGFTADPPRDRLLCERCEFVARRLGLPSSNQLAGRHVHIGRLVARQVCCRVAKERN